MPHVSTTDKGTQIMDGLLLSQYINSPLYRQYLLAYVEEMDLLFEAIEDVHFGRLIEDGIGAQLDIIGVILQQSRDVVLPIVFFGFVGASPVEGMSDEATPSTGGIFLSESQEGIDTVPLSDDEYKRLLKCKGSVMNSDDGSIETLYHALATLLGRIPPTFQLTTIANQEVRLTLLATDTTDREKQLILYVFDKFLLTAGTIYNIVLV